MPKLYLNETAMVIKPASGTVKHPPPKLVGWVRYPLGSNQRLQKQYLWPVKCRAQQ